MKIYAGLDGAEEQVLEFIDLVASRGQFDLLAGAKVSFDADAVLVVYLAEDLHWREDLISGIVAAMKEFTGHRVKAGYSNMAGSPILGYA